MISLLFLKISKLTKLNQDKFLSHANQADNTSLGHPLLPLQQHMKRLRIWRSIFGLLRVLKQHNVHPAPSARHNDVLHIPKGKKQLNSCGLEGLRSRSVGEGLATIAPCNG